MAEEPGLPIDNPDFYKVVGLKLPNSILGTGLVEMGWSDLPPDKKGAKGFVTNTFYDLPLSDPAENVTGNTFQASLEELTKDQLKTYMVMIDKGITTSNFTQFKEQDEFKQEKITQMRMQASYQGANVNTVQTIQGIFGDGDATPNVGVLETTEFQLDRSTEAFTFEIAKETAGLAGEDAGMYNTLVLHSKVYNRVTANLVNSGLTPEQLGMPAFVQGEIKVANGFNIVVNDTLCTPTAEFTTKYGANTYPFYVGYNRPIFYQELTETTISTYTTSLGGGTAEIHAVTSSGGGIKGVGFTKNTAPTTPAEFRDATNYEIVFPNSRDITIRRGITLEV